MLIQNQFRDRFYTELLSLNYRKKDSKYDVKKIFKRYIDEGEWETWQLRGLLNAAIDHHGDLHNVFLSFYDLYCDGYSFLDNLGLGYGLSVAVPPSQYSSDNWDKLTEDERRMLLASFYPSVQEEAKKVLSWLNEKKIVILSGKDELGHVSFLDNRSEEEKRPTAYKVAKQPRKERKPKWWRFWK